MLNLGSVLNAYIAAGIAMTLRCTSENDARVLVVTYNGHHKPFATCEEAIRWVESETIPGLPPVNTAAGGVTGSTLDMYIEAGYPLTLRVTEERQILATWQGETRNFPTCESCFEWIAGQARAYTGAGGTATGSAS